MATGKLIGSLRNIKERKLILNREVKGFTKNFDFSYLASNASTPCYLCVNPSSLSSDYGKKTKRYERIQIHCTPFVDEKQSSSTDRL